MHSLLLFPFLVVWKEGEIRVPMKGVLVCVCVSCRLQIAFLLLVLRNKERFLATRCCGSVGGSSWLYFTRQDCTYRHIYLYIGLVVVSLSLFFSALSLPACSSTGEESCVYKKLRAYDPHEGQGPLHGWFTRFDVATSFTIISRQSCLQERDISQIRCCSCSSTACLLLMPTQDLFPGTT